MRILHITDLHLDGECGTDEALRKKYFKEYLHGIIVESRSVDKVFVTGDIVNRYNIDRYEDAKLIVDHLCDELGVSIDDVFIVNGNHDICKESGRRDGFTSFLDKINKQKECVKKGERYSLFDMGEDAVLCLDSIGGNYSSGTPSCIDSESDEIVEAIQGVSAKNIFVLSHHPTTSKDIADLAVVEEKGWYDNHIWHSGNILMKRISSRAIKKDTVFWFSGDIHLPEHTVIDDSQIHFTTGSLCFFANADRGKTTPQARIFDTERKEESVLISFYTNNFQGAGIIGEWKKETVNAMVQSKIPSRTESLDVSDKKEDDLTFTVLNNKLDRDICSYVKENDLYGFGYLNESYGYVSLSWVSISGLFHKHELYGRIIQIFRACVKEVIDKSQYDNKNFIIVGVDNWGAIMASRIGAATNIRSCSVAVGNNDFSHVEEEMINDDLKHIVSKKKELFILSDVISTGSTVTKVIDQLDVNDTVPVHALSVIFDNNQNRPLNMKRFKGRYTACGSIRMPIIESFKIL